MSPKSIQQRLDALNDQLLFIKVNQHIEELISKSEEPPHICQGADCPNSDLNSCFGHTGCKGDGSCGCNHAKELDQRGNEIKTKALGSNSATPNKIIFDDGTEVEGFFIPSH